MKNKEKVIKGIMSDYVLWKRVSDAMFKMANVFAPHKKDKEWLTEYDYNGKYNAFDLLGIESKINGHDNLIDKLSSLTCDLIDTHSEMNAKELSEKIYIEWMVCLREECINLLSTE